MDTNCNGNQKLFVDRYVHNAYLGSIACVLHIGVHDLDTVLVTDEQHRAIVTVPCLCRRARRS
jgi:hypothetical protein